MAFLVVLTDSIIREGLTILQESVCLLPGGLYHSYRARLWSRYVGLYMLQKFDARGTDGDFVVTATTIDILRLTNEETLAGNFTIAVETSQ